MKNLTVAWTWGLNSTGVNGVHAARARRRSCSCGTTARRFRRSMRGPAPCSGSSSTRCPRTIRSLPGLLPDEAEPRDRRQQAHRADDRHAHHRARRQDGQPVWDVSTDDHKSPRTYGRRCTARHQRQGHSSVTARLTMARQRLCAWRRVPAGRMLHHRPRSRDGQATLAIQHDRAARRAWRRHLEQPAGTRSAAAAPSGRRAVRRRS